MKIKNQIIKFKDKYNTMSLPIKAAMWFTFSNIIQKGISTITVPIFTRILTTDQYGVYSVYQSWYSIVVIFATLNLFNGVFNNGMIKYPDRRDDFTSAMQSLATTITLILFVVYLFARDYFNQLFGLPPLLMILMFVQLLLSHSFSFWAARQRFEYKYKLLVAVTLLVAILNPSLGILAILNTGYKAEARILSIVLVESSIGLIIYIYNLVKGKTFFHKQFWKFALAFNIPLIPHYLSQSILQQSDRIMIAKFVGSSEAAIYGVAYSVSTLMIIVISAINNSFIPYTYNCLKHERYQDLRKNTNVLVTLVGLSTFLVVAFGPEVIMFFAPKEYYEAIWIIPPVSASVYFMFLYPIFGNIEFYFEENKFVVLASITGAILNVILNYIFIPIFGYIVAGYTTLFCYIVFSGGHYLFMKQVIKWHIPKKDPYDNKYLFKFSFVILLLVTLMNVSYLNTYFRYLLIIVMLIMAYGKRNLFISAFKEIKMKK